MEAESRDLLTVEQAADELAILRARHVLDAHARLGRRRTQDLLL